MKYDFFLSRGPLWDIGCWGRGCCYSFTSWVICKLLQTLHHPALHGLLGHCSHPLGFHQPRSLPGPTLLCLFSIPCVHPDFFQESLFLLLCYSKTLSLWGLAQMSPFLQLPSGYLWTPQALTTMSEPYSEISTAALGGAHPGSWCVSRQSVCADIRSDSPPWLRDQDGCTLQRQLIVPASGQLKDHLNRS